MRVSLAKSYFLEQRGGGEWNVRVFILGIQETMNLFVWQLIKILKQSTDHLSGLRRDLLLLLSLFERDGDLPQYPFQTHALVCSMKVSIAHDPLLLLS